MGDTAKKESAMPRHHQSPIQQRWRLPTKAVLLACLLFHAVSGLASTIIVEAYIEGRDYLIIEGNALRWAHVEGELPGRYEQRNAMRIRFIEPGGQATGEQSWDPQWEALVKVDGDPAMERRSSRMVLPADSEAFRILEHVEMTLGGNKARVIQKPSLANHFQTIIEFDDKAGGWHRVKLVYADSEPEGGEQTRPAPAVVPLSGHGMGMTRPGRPVITSPAGKGYRWEDENGRVHFSDKPPKGVPVETIELKAINILGDEKSRSEGAVFVPDDYRLPFRKSRVLARVFLTHDIQDGMPVDRLQQIYLDARQPHLWLLIDMTGLESNRPYDLRVRVIDAKNEVVFDMTRTSVTATNAMFTKLKYHPRRVADKPGEWTFQGMLNGELLFVEKRMVLFEESL